MVRHRRGGARPDRRRASASTPRSTRWRWSSRSTSASMAGVYYNTAAVIDADGTLPRQVPEEPHPADQRLLGEVLLQAGQPRLSRPSRRATRKIGVYICYDRHFPEGARLLGLHGAEIVFNPSATVAGPLAVPLEARAAGARRRERLLHRAPSNRVGTEAPWNIGKFYGIELLRATRAASSSRRRARTRTSSSSPR